jgi:hypothetical protein
MQIIEKVWLSENTLQIKNLPRVWYRNAASDIISSIHSENVVLNSIVNVEAKNVESIAIMRRPPHCDKSTLLNRTRKLLPSIM